MFFEDGSRCIALMLLPCLAPQQDMERLDPRGRTPLELAVCLGHLESTRVLLRHSSDPTHCNAQGWTSEFLRDGCRFHKGNGRCLYMWMCFSVLQEAVSTGDPELVQLVLQYRDFKRATERLAGIPELLSKLRQVKLVHLVLSPPGLISNRYLCHTTNLNKHLSKGLFFVDA